jgi:hypothetical protein
MGRREDCHWTNGSSRRDAERDKPVRERGGHGHDNRLGGQAGAHTRIHDHITSCVVGVLAGTVHEELFDESLNPVGVRDNHSGEVSGFAPPGDIHRIRNDGSETAISPAHLRHRQRPGRDQRPPQLQLTRAQLVSYVAVGRVEASRTAPSLWCPPPTTPSIRGGDRS